MRISKININGTDYEIDGKSAYDLAVANGYKGTEKEWLASLKGENGTVITDASGATKKSLNIDSYLASYLKSKKYAGPPSEFRAGGEIPYWFNNGSEGAYLTYAKLADHAESGGIAKRNSNGDIMLPASQTIADYDDYAISAHTASLRFSKKIYRHRLVLEVHGTSFDMVLRWEEYSVYPQSKKFTNAAGQVPNASQLSSEALAHGFLLDGTYTMLVTGFQYENGTLSLFGISGAASLLTGEVYTFSRPKKLALSQYAGTAGAIKITDTISVLN